MNHFVYILLRPGEALTRHDDDAAHFGFPWHRSTRPRPNAAPSPRCDDRRHERSRMKLLTADVLRFFAVGLLCILAGSPCRSQAQDGLEYQSRGHYFEGVRPSPVSGFDIELLSGVVEHGAQPRTMPDVLTLSFFADRAESISLTVREVDNSHFYWLDRVRPEVPWAGGRTSNFRWDTRKVLQRMAPPLRVVDLGVVVRVGRAEPSADEQILPAALIADLQPVTVAAYRFTFKPCCDANVSCSLHAQNAEAALVTQVFRRTPGGRPFSCRIDAATLAGGAYRIVLVGYLTETNQRIHQVVRFSHRATLP